MRSAWRERSRLRRSDGRPGGDETAAAEEGALPLEVVLEGARFGLDRPVPVDPAGLEQVGEDDGVLLFAIPGGPPFDRVYGAPDIAVVARVATSRSSRPVQTACRRRREPVWPKRPTSPCSTSVRRSTSTRDRNWT